MKKSILGFLLLTMTLGAASCQKCATCECGAIDQNFCVDEFDSKDDYDEWLDGLKDNGCDCSEKLAGA